MSALLRSLPKWEGQAYGKAYAELCHTLPLVPIETPKHYAFAMAHLAKLGDILESNHDLREDVAGDIAGYMRALGILVEAYEKGLYQATKLSGADILRDLMARHGLSQGSFAAEIGPQPAVNRILSGERELTKRHIERLAKRFNISPAVFFGAVD